MNEGEKTALRSIAAIGFVAIFGVVLARPLFQTDDGPAPPPTTPTSPTSPKPPQDGADRLRGEPYPPPCLVKAQSPQGFGLIAIASAGRIQIGTPASVVARLSGRGPIAWSAGGRYLGIAGDSVYDVQTGELGPLLDRVLTRWVWSPTSECVAGITAGRALVAGRPGRTGATIVEENVRSFAFSQNGRYVSVSLRGGEGTVIDLKRGREWKRAPLSALEFDGPIPCRRPNGVTEASCSPNGRFTAGVRRGRLTLYEGSRLVRILTKGPYRDRHPEWGPPRSGVLFVRARDGSERTEVWFLPEGGNPNRTALMAQSDIDGIDWSATPPTGLPF